MSDYHIIITDAGAALETAAHAVGEPLVLTEFAVCDGDSAFTPDPTMTSFAGEVYRGEISSLTVCPDAQSVLVAQCIIPASSGGYTIRGIGIYAGDTLYAVGNYPDQPKPAPDSGYAASLEILAQLAVSNTADVTLNVTDGAWLTKEEGDQLYVPLIRKVNGHELKDDVNITSDDVGAVPCTRKINGHVLSNDIVLTAIDAGAIPNRGYLGANADLNTLTGSAFGRYYQGANVNAANGKNYPVAAAGALDVIQNGATTAEGCTQEYRPYNSNVVYRRRYDAANKVWSPWNFDITNAGGLITGELQIKKSGLALRLLADANQALYIQARDSDNTPRWYIGNGSANSTDVAINNYKTGTHLLLSTTNRMSGTLNITGNVIPTSYSNFDSRYAATTAVYSKEASDGRYNLKNTVSVKTATRLVSKDSTTGIMEVVMSGISVSNKVNTSVTFPVAFPNACTGVVITYNGAGHGSGDDSAIFVPSYSRTGCVLYAHNASGKFMLIAKGY